MQIEPFEWRDIAAIDNAPLCLSSLRKPCLDRRRCVSIRYVREELVDVDCRLLVAIAILEQRIHEDVKVHLVDDGAFAWTPLLVGVACSLNSKRIREQIRSHRRK